ncbi:accessory Sec system protein translocase subunit SecY2 [Staphylococcus lutrae]|uniref:Accessory Sec system protein translocase subunit SecY2 n=1 Tax=Staphylococcus lutrae TaxID=155085 RepID=A0AAC9WJ10_9STAP|nr:accessory Sec system protein translocase subunit SecY2 [Staphylococcus lutrae]ARJ50849.1 accessory Sec system protein translocase subunit SecY2 [Staphylococcus lutrae]PNZ39695.1 accessory Sec system protein translocase subunit SecY2 [Staphylococcus lutrae]
MGRWTRLNDIKNIEYKVLYKKIFFTLMVLFVYVLGSHLKVAHTKGQPLFTYRFFDLAISNVGGNIRTLNIFSLGLSPWLTAMIIMTLISYRNSDQKRVQTRVERHFKERLLTLLIAMVQGAFILYTYANKGEVNPSEIPFLLLILVSGAMLLTWLADQNVVYGIAGPTPMILVGMVQSLFQSQALMSFNLLMVVIVLGMFFIVLISLLWLELIEYRIVYRDIMNVSTSEKDTYLSWKLNPAGSLSIMFNFSLFFLLGIIVHLIEKWVTGQDGEHMAFLSLRHPIGVLIFILMLVILNYYLSRLMLNAEQKAKEFQKSGNYFEGIYPGDETRKFLKRKASRISAIGAFAVGCIISLPLILSIFNADIAREVSIFTQLVIFIYMTINIVENIRTYLYFDQYASFLDQYR